MFLCFTIQAQLFRDYKRRLIRLSLNDMQNERRKEMPSYKGHLAGGAVTFILVQQLMQKVTIFQKSPKYLLLAAMACLLGSLFPDIDTKSMGQRIFYMILAMLTFSSIIAKQWVVLLSIIPVVLLPFLVRHRGITHRLLFVILAPLLIPLIVSICTPEFYILAWLVYAYFVSGALSHLALDYLF
jgi:membrane-bound metal-dependent hydrolase YbcI (DUF457 family)